MKVKGRIPYPHPGSYLKEILDDLGISMYRFAKHIEVPENRISRLVQGKTSITIDTAMRLSKALGTSVQMWLNLQMGYELEEMKINGDERYDTILELPELSANL